MNRVIASVFVAACIPLVSSFLLEGNCPLGPPCECVYHTITCSRQNLSSIPSFAATKEHYNTIAVTFNFNQLTKVPARAFSTLGTTGAVSVDVKLAWNQITTVDPDAFEGIQNAITLLDLSDNKLTTLPAALSKLSALKTLNIDGNPLASLPSTIMSAIGDTVTSLGIGLDSFTAWPVEMKTFASLRELTITGLHATTIPNDAFSGFNSTLQTLTLERTMLDNIPSAVCTLQNARTFTFSSNYFINRNSGPPCDVNTSVATLITTLTLSDDDLPGIPSLFDVFPAVTRLSVSDNQIVSIYDNAAAWDGNNVAEFDLTNNSLAAVPHALNRFKKLTVLRLDYNSIPSIGANDFSSITSLRLLYLTHNPITSIDPQAFVNNQQITILDLSDTQLTSLPVAVMSLPNLSIFHVSDGQIECSCSAMASLKTWNASKIHSSIGMCKKSSETIKDFVRNDLKNC